MTPLFRFDSCPRDDDTLLKYSMSTSVTQPQSRHHHQLYRHASLSPSLSSSTSSPPSPPTPKEAIPVSVPDAANTLQALVDQYQSQPDLLKMILYSKVEEDKRKAEEARLRVKQLDLYMSLKEKNKNTKEIRHQHHKDREEDEQREQDQGQINARHTPPPHPLSPRRHSISLDETTLTSASSASTTSPTALFLPNISLSYPLLKPIPILPNRHRHQQQEQVREEEEEEEDAYEIRTRLTGRKRRCMQAVTKIVETKDPFYKDNYLWKNNGNTIRRKTGCKSTYYKCSNASKGCPVNKTVLFQAETGECVIKYRGQHLSFCGKVEHICDL